MKGMFDKRDKEADKQAITKVDRRRYNVCRSGGRSSFAQSADQIVVLISTLLYLLFSPRMLRS
jgi:hypothetical protein